MQWITMFKSNWKYFTIFHMLFLDLIFIWQCFSLFSLFSSFSFPLFLSFISFIISSENQIFDRAVYQTTVGWLLRGQWTGEVCMISFRSHRHWTRSRVKNYLIVITALKLHTQCFMILILDYFYHFHFYMFVCFGS